jgi:8-oxo-dGTP pyrophosphatase MutT (NUDIX family)
MTHGIINHQNSLRPTDYLYRVSLKCLIQNEKGEVLVVKERGRDYWDLPGGGMDHGEGIKAAIAREMYEEVRLKDDFAFRVIHVEDPALLASHDFWQLRLIFAVTPDSMAFSVGDDGDEVAFMSPNDFTDSNVEPERLVCDYARIAINPF